MTVVSSGLESMSS